MNGGRLMRDEDVLGGSGTRGTLVGDERLLAEVVQVGDEVLVGRWD